MRVTDGARRINTQGGGVFIHEGGREDEGTEVRIPIDPPQSPLAPIEVRNLVYSALLRLSPATLYPGALITGEKGLLTRGLKERHFGEYGGLPADSRERDRIARRLVKEIKGSLPQANLLRGVPGFWQDGNGAHLWKPKDYLLPALLIPARDELGRIQACQMRLPSITKKGKRYLWLSSSDLPHGTGSGGPLHFKFRPSNLPHDAMIVIIEGVLKADVFFALRPDHFVVGAPSVTTNHEALIELTHGRKTIIAFDGDSYTNKTVFFHLAGLVAKRLRRERTHKTTYIALWDARANGIDDAALHNFTIKAIGISDWINSLSPQFQIIAAKRFSEIIIAPTPAGRGGKAQ
jgi:hypothetical protein